MVRDQFPEAHFIFALAARVALTIGQILLPASGALVLFFRQPSVARNLR